VRSRPRSGYWRPIAPRAGVYPEYAPAQGAADDRSRFGAAFNRQREIAGFSNPLSRAGRGSRDRGGYGGGQFFVLPRLEPQNRRPTLQRSTAKVTPPKAVTDDRRLDIQHTHAVEQLNPSSPLCAPGRNSCRATRHRRRPPRWPRSAGAVRAVSTRRNIGVKASRAAVNTFRIVSTTRI